MWIEKLVDGVIELDTPIGPRYLQPSFSQRAFLMWTFRNFFSLPPQVLRPRESRLIDQLCGDNRFVSLTTADGERPIIGRIERRPPTLAPAVAEALPVRKPASSANSAVAKQSEEAASA